MIYPALRALPAKNSMVGPFALAFCIDTSGLARSLVPVALCKRCAITKLRLAHWVKMV